MFRELYKDEEGQGLMEYVLILSLVAIAVIAALTIFGLRIDNYYNNIVGVINGV